MTAGGKAVFPEASVWTEAQRLKTHINFWGFDFQNDDNGWSCSWGSTFQP